MIGLGVFQAEDGEQSAQAVQWALEAGYKHIDTAYIYGNEKGVGQGIAKSGVKREEIFVTTKAWNEHIRQGTVREYFLKSLENLGLDYVDLYLIHWPVEGRIEAWKEMIQLYEEKKIRAIGVSNFQVHHLKELVEKTGFKPMVNQIESNPVFNNGELIAYCQSENIAVEAWSPLGGSETSILDNETLLAIGEKYGKSPAQVIIRWNIQRNVIVLPKSVKQQRIIQNYNVYDFALSDEEMQAINDLNQNKRCGADPDNFNF